MTDAEWKSREIELGIKAAPPEDREIRMTAVGMPSGVHHSYCGRTAQMQLRLTPALIREFRDQAAREGLHYNSLFMKIWLMYREQHRRDSDKQRD